jgi:hypothetical protein
MELFEFQAAAGNQQACGNVICETRISTTVANRSIQPRVPAGLSIGD